MENRQYAAIVSRMAEHDKGSPKRIQHFLKVHAFARTIGTAEGLDDEELDVLETAALVHDIGIRDALVKYGSEAGPYQEKEGPALAKQLLEETGGYTAEQIERVMYLVGHHHTYTDIRGMDYRILVEADFLVDLYEKQADRQAVGTAYDRIFRTETGRRICREMLLEERQL